MSKIKYPFVIFPAEEGVYVAEIPDLKGCLAQGEDLAETLAELETVAELWIETAIQNGENLPDAEKEYKRIRQRLAA